MADARTLLIIDIQRDYFPGGAYPLVEPEGAAVHAAFMAALAYSYAEVTSAAELLDA